MPLIELGFLFALPISTLDSLVQNSLGHLRLGLLWSSSYALVVSGSQFLWNSNSRRWFDSFGDHWTCTGCDIL